MVNESARNLLVDVHTHIYPPSYMSLLRRRTTIPRVHADPDTGAERVLLLKEEADAVDKGGSSGKGRPVGPQYWDRDEKIKFMDTHGIDVSVVSLANPWLDFLSAEEAASTAKELNEDLESYCATYSPSASSTASGTKWTPLTQKRLFAFGSLPLVPGIEIPTVLSAIEQVRSAKHLRGVVMGTRGLGKGLDDDAMEPIWAALADSGLVVFVHPHYGVEGAFGDKDNGHVLPLALGFPFETTIAIARLILAGVLDRHPSLRLLLAHSAGALPALSSRLASCVLHDPVVKDRLEHDVRYYLGQLWFDAVTYGAEELALTERVIARADGYEGRDEELPYVDRVTSRQDLVEHPDSFPGCDRIMFGTDHPFFPPVGGSEQDDNDPNNTTSPRWRSVDENLEAITSVAGWTDVEREKIMGSNAVELFALDLESEA